MPRKDYKIANGRLVATRHDDAPVQLYWAPTETERAQLIGRCRIDAHTLDAALDPEEAPRVETDDGCTFIVWKRPRSAQFRTQVLFDVSSVAFVVQPDRLTVIAADDPPDLERVRTRPLGSLHDLLLREML